MDGRDRLGEIEVTDPNEEDRFLVEQYLRLRDEDSFDPIYRRHSDAIFRLSLALTGAPERAADIVQETWLRAAERLETFRWSSTLRTWLSGITVNCCRESWRAERFSEGAPDLGQIPAIRGERVDLMRAIRDLPDRSRAVLVLHEIFGYTHSEIASMLGIDEGTSKSQLSYSKTWVRRWFDRRKSGRGERDAELR